MQVLEGSGDTLPLRAIPAEELQELIGDNSEFCSWDAKNKNVGELTDCWPFDRICAPTNYLEDRYADVYGVYSTLPAAGPTAVACLVLGSMPISATPPTAPRPRVTM